MQLRGGCQRKAGNRVANLKKNENQILPEARAIWLSQKHKLGKDLLRLLYYILFCFGNIPPLKIFRYAQAEKGWIILVWDCSSYTV